MDVETRQNLGDPAYRHCLTAARTASSYPTGCPRVRQRRWHSFIRPYFDEMLVGVEEIKRRCPASRSGLLPRSRIRADVMEGWTEIEARGFDSSEDGIELIPGYGKGVVVGAL